MMVNIARAALARLKRPNQSGIPYGVFIASIDPATTEIAASAGYDFVLIDGEHGPLDRLTVLSDVRAAEAAGIIPLARGIDGSNGLIQQMLDLGVAGVVVSKLETAAQVRRIVAASRYAPEGTRGMCPSCHDGRYTVKTFVSHMKSRKPASHGHSDHRNKARHGEQRGNRSRGRYGYHSLWPA